MNTRTLTLIALTLSTSAVGCAAGPTPLALTPSELTSTPERTHTPDWAGSEMCTMVRRGAHGAVKDARIAEHWPSKNYGDASSAFAGTVSGGARHTLLGFELPEMPAGAHITSAKIRLHKCVCGGSGVSAHLVNTSWSEDSVTWDSFANAYDQQAFAELPVGADDHTSLDITELARGWADGSTPNNGILLAQATANTAFSTSESSDEGQRPTLEVCWSSN